MIPFTQQGRRVAYMKVTTGSVNDCRRSAWRIVNVAADGAFFQRGSPCRK
jgi:hypothetical protein